MGWDSRYAIVSYLRSSLWTVPLFALVVEQIGIRFLTFIDRSLKWVPALEVTAAEASDALATIESLMIAFLVFTFGSMLVALQVASAQLTPRIIATTLLRDNTIRFTRRLYAIIEDLMNVLPETRQAVLHRQLHVLNDALEQLHLLPEDQTLARHPDRQGLAGSSTPYEQQPRRTIVRGD